MKLFFAINVIRYSSIFFILGVLIAMFFYPGGNIHDPNQLGYSFTHNFLSDLGGYKSHSGEINFLSSTFFALSLSVFALAGISFLLIPLIFDDDRINFYFCLIGAILFFIGAIFFSAVGFTPYDLYFEEHIFFAKNSFRLMIPASFFILIALIRSKISKHYLYIISVFLVSTIFYVIYLNIGGNPIENQDDLIPNVIAQKLIVFVSMICIFLVTFAFSDKLNQNKKYAGT